MRMASYVSRELIPCAFVWLDPGITPCCKTRKLQRQEFFAKTRSGRRSPIRIPSVAVPKSPVSLTREDQSPHVFTRKTRLQPAEFLITCAKRLLQHNRVQEQTSSGHARMSLNPFETWTALSARPFLHGDDA